MTSDAARLTVTSLRMPYAEVGEDPLPLVDALLDPPLEVAALPAALHPGASVPPPRSLHPYLIQSRYGRHRTDTDLDCIVLENEHLRARFLPQLGGRLWSLVERASGRELLYRNDVIQPANLALRNAWFAGGVEWNIGTKGHAPHTMSALHAAQVTGPDGVPALRMWEFERLRRVVFQIDARLSPGSPALHVYVRIRNPNDVPVPMYWWSNAAVPERADVRVVAPASSAYATSYDGTVQVAPIPVHDSIDRTWPTRSPHAADYFFELAGASRPWIAAVDASGHGLAQASTDRLIGRKLFCWGTGAGGRRWQRWLSPEGGDYLEIQAGLAATQFEHLMMPAGASWSWLEAYGNVRADPAIAHGADWGAATNHVEACLDRLAPAGGLSEAFDHATRLADSPPDTVLGRASGWGALEREARQVSGESWLDESGTPFPADTITADEQPWRALLHDDVAAVDALLHADPVAPPRSYVVGAVWEDTLSRLPTCWARDYHLAVLAHARGDLAAAHERYSASVAHQPTAWALRGLARIATQQRDLVEAARLLSAAAALAPAEPSIVVDAATAALDAEDAAAAISLIDSARGRLETSGRLRLLEARARWAVGDRDRAAEILTTGIEVPDIREGETALSDLWQQVFPGEPLPAAYDFRMR